MRGKRNLHSIGDTYGKLKVIEIWSEKRPTHKSKEKFCKCLCECGNTITVPGRYLRSQHKLSCGCLQYPANNKHPSWKGYAEISSTWWNGIKNSAKRKDREIPFNIRIEDAWNLFIKQKRKCALSGVPLKFSYKNTKWEGCNNQTASLDRIDCYLDYDLDNVQWVHKTLNKMKLTLTDEEFIEWCKLVYLYNKPKPKYNNAHKLKTFEHRKLSKTRKEKLIC